MSSAEAGEVALCCFAAVGVVFCVVEVAFAGGDAAAGESAVLVACPEGAFHGFGGLVSVDAEYGAGDGVGEDAVPSFGGPGEFAGGVGVDGGDAVEFGYLVGF